MKEGPEKIYYITADSYAAAKTARTRAAAAKGASAAALRSHRQWMMRTTDRGFDGKAFQSVAKATMSPSKNWRMKSTKENAKEAEKALEPFDERVKTLLGDRVKEVRLTHRL